MESLRERATPTSEVEADAIGLVRSQGRYQPPPGRKQRVRARLLEHRIEQREGRSRALFALAVALVVVFAVGTSLALGRDWIARSYRALSGQVPTEPVVQPQQPERPVAASPPAAPEEKDPPSVPDPSPDKQPAAGAAPRPRVRSATEDDRLVFEAMRALRQEGQPDRAARSLDEYLKRHPDGELAEEALALSIEAATVRNDPRAKDLASRYLAKYPKGRFRSAAERARARFSP